MAAQGLSTLKFSLPNGVQKSDDPAAFLGSQYVAPAVEANLPLGIDSTIWLIAPLATALYAGFWVCGLPDRDCRGHHGGKFALD